MAKWEKFCLPNQSCLSFSRNNPVSSRTVNQDLDDLRDAGADAVRRVAQIGGRVCLPADAFDDERSVFQGMDVRVGDDRLIGDDGCRSRR